MPPWPTTRGATVWRAALRIRRCSITGAKNIQTLQLIHSDYRKKGFEVVSVSYDKPEDKAKLDKFIKENGIKWPVYFDGQAAKNDFAPKLNATSSPRLMIFDQGGILQSQ